MNTEEAKHTPERDSVDEIIDKCFRKATLSGSEYDVYRRAIIEYDLQQNASLRSELQQAREEIERLKAALKVSRKYVTAGPMYQAHREDLNLIDKALNPSQE